MHSLTVDKSFENVLRDVVVSRDEGSTHSKQFKPFETLSWYDGHHFHLA